ncbi:restriction endonuclease subunit S [Emticicia sp.]|uniref:restriction endonuclease subunit S n=1 Tax=Emticicia sp. TaxID=1930953 RepID=UPI003753D653
MSEWKETNIGKLATFSKGRLTVQSDNIEDGYLPLINADAVNGKPILFSHTKGAVLCEENDILMLWDGERSGLVTIGHNGVVGSTFSKLQTIDGIDSKYLFYFLYNKFSWIQNNRTGTGVPHVPKDIAKILFVKYPEDKNEQRKIAKILSSADTVIEKTQVTIAKYKAIKQGMLNDLFTRGIDIKTGKLRPSYAYAPELYKESALGWIPKEWEVDKLGELIKVSSGEGLTLNNIKIGSYPVYGGNGINGYHSEYLFAEKRLIIGRVGEYCGNAYITQSFSWVTDNALIVSYIEKEFDFDFWVTYLNFLNLNSFAYAAAQPVITGGIINKIPIVRISLTEQKAISKRILAIDQKISVEQLYLQKLQQLKSGLMADLLSGKKLVTIPESIEPQTT